MRVAFLGIGNMGRPMALNLLDAGFGVVVYDVVRPDEEVFTQRGGSVADSAEEALKEADAVITMLPHANSVSEVWRKQIFPTLKAGGDKILLLDCSTIDVDTARQMHLEANQLGFLTLDAPVSGGVSAATAGTLTFMCGGEPQAFTAAETLLQAMGKNIFHCGSAGSGQAAKICNNMMLGPQMLAVCEAFALAESLGLAPDKLFEVSAVSSGQCWALTSYCPWPGLVETAPSNNDYQAGFAAALMLKDLRLSQQAAKEGGVATPFAAMATEYYENFVDANGTAIDFSAIIKMVLENKS